MTTLTIQNVRSIQSAEIDLAGPFTMLCGDNGEGKTSVLLALKACLTGTTACISSRQKDDADGMCADGSDRQAAAILKAGENHKTARWSKSKCYPIRSSKSVAGLPQASNSAAGLPDFLSEDPKHRAKVFFEAFQIEPTSDDLHKAIENARIDVDAVEIWNQIVINGWDGSHQEALNVLTGMKGEWSGVTCETWGEDKAKDWAPDCTDETSVTREQMAKLEKAMVDSAEAAAKAKAERQAIVVPPAPGQELACPHCSKKVIEVGGELRKAEPVNEKERERLLQTRNALEGKVVGLQDDARYAERAFTEAQAAAQRAEDHRDERIKRAGEIQFKIEVQTELVNVLGPDGVRGRKRDQILHLLNGQLQELGAIVGLDSVRLVWESEPSKKIDTICARIGNRLFQNLAKSEQWRVRLLIQALIAKRDGSDMILLDECEILSRQRRGPLIKLLKQCDIHAVLAMTISDGVTNAPDLGGPGLGQTYWIEGGKVMPLDEAKSAAMKAAA